VTLKTSIFVFLTKLVSINYNSSYCWKMEFDMKLNLYVGGKVLQGGTIFRVKGILDLENVLLEPLDKTGAFVGKIEELEPIAEGSGEQSTARAGDLLSIPKRDWDQAKKREMVLAPLLKKAVCTLPEAETAAKELSLTYRQIYNLLKRYRNSGGNLRALLPEKPGVKQGKSRISGELEQIIRASIEDTYLTDQKNKISRVVEEVKLKCFRANLEPPSERTIRRRLENCATQKEIIAKREGYKAARGQYKPVFGVSFEVEYPLQIYQIDHTKVDLIIVDEIYRRPIGRPYITVAIDVYSRCIAGFCLTLDPPSSVSVGLCLAHSAIDKKAWLAQRELEGEWPIWGVPDSLYVDNGKDFHSEALKRGCEAHGIAINYRPVGQPHYGGIVERIIGTLMSLIHGLPGTTFSNVQEKGNYDSEKKAILTLSELERWIAIAITQYYHKKVHSGLLQPPVERYKIGILGDRTQKGRGIPAQIRDRERFLIDFLPVEYRTIQRHGFMLDKIAYSSQALSPLIADRRKHTKFLIRRDPRDLSKVYVLEPKSQEYIEVCYRTLSRPTISLWEHRMGIKFLREKGISKRDEGAIFEAIESMRRLTKEACEKSKLARKRLAQQPKSPEKIESDFIVRDKATREELSKIEPYSEIEVW
jgi:putative transposase